MSPPERPRDILYASFLSTCVAGVGGLMGLFGGSWLLGVRGVASFVVSAFLGWLYYSFLMGHVHFWLEEISDRRGQDHPIAAFRLPLLMWLAVGPLGFLVGGFFYMVQGAHTTATVMLTGGGETSKLPSGSFWGCWGEAYLDGSGTGSR